MTAPAKNATTADLRAKFVSQMANQFSSVLVAAAATCALDDLLAAARAEAVAPLEARVKELERDLALMTHSRDGFREAVIAGESTRARVKELTEVLRQLVEQIGKSVGLPPPPSQCAAGHAYSDFAQAINAALALLAADQAGEKAGKP